MPIEGFVADIVRDEPGRDPLVIEVQTGSFGALGGKLDRLLCDYRVTIVHPIAVRTVLERPPAKPRRSPERNTVFAVFDELVAIPTLLEHPNLAIDVVLVEVTRFQVHDPAVRRRRGGWRTVEHRLDTVMDTVPLRCLDDLAALLPCGLPAPFTTADLAQACGIGRDQAQRMAFCLRTAGLLEQLGRRRDGIVYRRAPTGR